MNCDLLFVWGCLCLLAAMFFWWRSRYWKERYYALRNLPVIREIERQLLTEQDIVDRAAKARFKRFKSPYKS